MEWTGELVIQFIKEYKKRRVLWDVKHKHFRASRAKKTAWQELAAIFDCDVEDAQKKMASIMASHRRERRKLREGKRSDWFAYTHLNFLCRSQNEVQTAPWVNIIIIIIMLY